MSTLISNTFTNLIPVNRWIQNRRKHYKQATDQYSAQIRKLLESDTKRKLSEISSRSICISIESNLTPLNGITLARCTVPDAKPGEKVSVINLADEQPIANGFVLSVGSNVKIKFLNPIIGKQSTDNDNDKDDLNNKDNLNDNDNSKDDAKIDCKIKFDDRNIFDRHECIAYALSKLRRVSCSLPLHQCLIGKYDNHSDTLRDRARVMTFKKLPELGDRMQSLAVEQSMRRRISLVEGPAGSGKTLIATHIACNMNRLKKYKVLLCSPIQANVNKLASMIEPIEGIHVVELPNRDLKLPKPSEMNGRSNHKNKLDKLKSKCHLDKLVDAAIYRMAWNRCKEVFGGHEELIHSHASRVVATCSPWLRHKFERKMILKADVVCCNLLQAGSYLLNGTNFDMVIIDDAQVSTEIDCLVPIMTKGIKQVTLLSDLRRDIRLPRRHSLKLCKSSSNEDLSNSNHVDQKSKRHSNPREMHRKNKLIESEMEPTNKLGGLFERWLSIGISAVALKYQYRAHETLSDFANHHFYRRSPKDNPKNNDKLSLEISNNLLKDADSFDWLPKNNCLTALFDTLSSGNSINDTVRTIVNNLVSKENIHKSRIGIIINVHTDTFQSPNSIYTCTVDEFVGQEKDFIIIVGLDSSADSNPARADFETGKHLPSNGIQCDFLHDDGALNVALTRARLGMFIVVDLKNLVRGDNSTVDNDGLTNTSEFCISWQKLVSYYANNKLVT